MTPCRNPLGALWLQPTRPRPRTSATMSSSAAAVVLPQRPPRPAIPEIRRDALSPLFPVYRRAFGTGSVACCWVEAPLKRKQQTVALPPRPPSAVRSFAGTPQPRLHGLNPAATPSPASPAHPPGSPLRCGPVAQIPVAGEATHAASPLFSGRMRSTAS
jgi:hypothetical protein